MFCHQCGANVSDNSRFCHNCGQAQSVNSATGAAAAVAPAPTPTFAEAPNLQHSATKWILGLLLFFFACWGVWDITLHHVIVPSTAQSSASAQPQPQLHVQSTGDVALAVRAGDTQFYRLTVPAGAFNVSLKGHFVAAGGSGNDIEAYVVNEDEYVNLRNGHPAHTYYNSGKVTQDTLNVVLPPDAGTYYVVFTNKFSFLTAKAVQVNLSLQYYTH